MHFRCKAVAGLLSVLAVVGITLAQGPPGVGRGAGGDVLSLLNNPQVRKELGITDEQVERIPDAVLESLSKVLEPGQTKRLRQIQVQQMGNRAFLNAKIQKELKITESQAESIKTILDDAAKAGQGRFGGFGKGGDFKEAAAKAAAARAETNEKVMDVLTTTQRTAYSELIGEEFRLERGGFGGFGGGKGGFGGKGGKGGKGGFGKKKAD